MENFGSHPADRLRLGLGLHLFKTNKEERMRKIAISIAAVGALALSACGDESRKDADKSGQRVDRSSAEVIAMPDAFRNIAHKCDGHGHRVYSSSTGNDGTYAQIFVIDDPSCGGTP